MGTTQAQRRIQQHQPTIQQQHEHDTDQQQQIITQQHLTVPQQQLHLYPARRVFGGVLPNRGQQ
ncbi:unnamed protein product [Oikopleura dioica]|uniref:Uncharacterized protein n=1 Tax=Oikopleura dioica TaxID=34765 RepID=E4X693_OIKDI|nr:unnamed protein product [Oikopleura dioica]